MRSLALLLLLPAAAHAASLTLGPSKDNSLYEDTLGGLSNGSGPTLFVGRTGGGGIRRGLLEFDLTMIPAGSTIHTVTLNLFLIQAQAFPTDVTLHAVQSEWGEGSSSGGNRGGGGATAAPSDATWIHTFYNGSFWASSGGDFLGTASGATVVGAEGVGYQWASTAALVADVQRWIDTPANNHGWLLRGDESQNGTAKAFATRENSEAAHRPSLTVSYTQVPEPSAWLAVFGGVGMLFAVRHRRRA